MLLAGPAIAAAPIKAKLVTSTATPVVDRPWRWTVTVRNAAGKPLPARMGLQRQTRKLRAPVTVQP